jgi:citrate lyase subunit beta/citryl-CoA lyase
MPKQQMIFAARSGGIMPLGYIASVASYGDWEAFRRMVRRSRQFGFLGASCIHPGQVTIVNEEYSPSPEEVAHAKRVVEENARAAAAGRASFAIDGKMIDVPVVTRAERLLERDAVIRAREAAKRAAS